jgi:hypothetical protein
VHDRQSGKANKGEEKHAKNSILLRFAQHIKSFLSCVMCEADFDEAEEEDAKTSRCTNDLWLVFSFAFFSYIAARTGFFLLVYLLLLVFAVSANPAK